MNFMKSDSARRDGYRADGAIRILRSNRKSLRRQTAQHRPSPTNKKADGFGFRPPVQQGSRPLRHFDDSLQLRLTFALRRARILGAQQPRSDPQSIHLFADPQQLLLFHSQYVVRVFHWGRASTTNSDLFRLSRNTVSQFSAPGKLPEVHRGWESSLSRMRLTGRCPVIIKLMPQMIGMILKDGESTI